MWRCVWHTVNIAVCGVVSVVVGDVVVLCFDAVCGAVCDDVSDAV